MKWLYFLILLAFLLICSACKTKSLVTEKDVNSQISACEETYFIGSWQHFLSAEIDSADLLIEELPINCDDSLCFQSPPVAKIRLKAKQIKLKNKESSNIEKISQSLRTDSLSISEKEHQEVVVNSPIKDSFNIFRFSLVIVIVMIAIAIYVCYKFGILLFR